MNTPIDLSPEKNPARCAAMIQAQNRATREGKPMFVFVRAGAPFNVWFVRSADEGAPPDANEYHVQAPEIVP